MEKLYYIHDVWVNWVDGTSKGYEIPEYHEWRKDDIVELYDQLPVAKVTKDFFNFLENDYGVIPQTLLDEVYLRAAKREDRKRIKVEHAFVISDGENVLAINTDGDNKPNMKSRLVPRHERLVLEIVEEEPVFEFKWTAPEHFVEDDDSLMSQILDLKAEYLVGLTRTEREMKEIVMDCLFNLSVSENRAEVKYWYIELFPDMIGHPDLDTAELEDMVSHMFDFLKDGWSDHHEYFGSLLVRYFDIFKETWEELVVERKKAKVAK